MDRNVPLLKENLFSAQQDTDEDKVKVKVLNSSQKSLLYHFKVMKLRNHEDRDQQEISAGQFGSECRVLFQFYFELLKTKKQQSMVVEEGKKDK